MHATQHTALGIPHFHQAASRGHTTDGAAIGSYHQPRRAVRHGDGRYGDRQGNRRVAGGIGLLQGNGVACGQWAVEVDQEGAIRCDHPGADHVAIAIPDFNRGTRFTTAGNDQAASTQHHIADNAGRGDVRGYVAQRQRGVACGVGHPHADGFAIGLRRVEGEAETAIRFGEGTADHVASSVAYLYPGTGLGIAGQADAIDQRQVGGLQWRHLIRCGQRAWAGHVASGIGQGHLQ